MQNPKNTIAASILAADFGHLADECQAIIHAGADVIHFDVMDHHFVPNLSFGAVICKSLRKNNITATIDVHLMVENPEDHIEAFAKAGANMITFHPETTKNVNQTLQAIRDHGLKAGLAFNPDKKLIIDDINLIDLILIMSVYPGFGGQKFMPEVLPKVTEALKLADNADHHIDISIDGGINLETISAAKDAGANFFVMGSALFGEECYKTSISKFHDLLEV